MNKLIILFFLGWSVVSSSQKINIIEEDSKLPIEGAIITLSGDPNTYITDEKGDVNIPVVKADEMVIFQSPGFKMLTLSYGELLKLNGVVVLEIQNFELNHIVISGTRWKQSSDKVPSKIISISPKEVAFQNPQTAADLLGISSKVFIQKSQQGGGSPMIRGFATNRLIYTVDGVRMNTAIFRSGNIQNVINLDPFATQNAEVLFGPGSVIYGSDAVGGVMAFQTLIPNFSTNDKMLFSGKLNTRYSSANQEKTFHGDINLGIKKWAFVTSFSSWNFDHLKQGKYGPSDYIKKVHVIRQGNEDVVIQQKDSLLQIPTAYKQYNIMQKIRFNPNKNWDLQYGFHYSKTSTYGRYDRHNRFRNGSPRYAEWNYGPQSWMMNLVSVEYKNKSILFDEMNARLAYQKFGESRIDRNLNSKTRNTQSESVDAYSFNLDFVKKLSAKNKAFYGFEYVLNDVTSTGVLSDVLADVNSAGPSRYPQSQWTSAAIYINDEFKVNELLTLQGGIRYNLFSLSSDFANNLPFYNLPFEKSKINKDALTGSFGGVFKANESLIFRANAGTAFRAPNVDDIGKIFDAGEGFVTVPNTNLKAEYAYNFDLGLAKIFSDHVKIDLSVYHTSLANAMVRRNFTFNGQDSVLYNGVMSRVQAIQNVAIAKVYGIQAGLEIKIGHGFWLYSDWNYQHGEEELDDGSTSPSRHAAPMFGTNRLRYQKKKLMLEINTNHQSERSFDKLPQEEQAKTEIYAKDDNGNPFSPAWYTLNFKGLYEVSKYIHFTVGVENITDQRYRPYSSGLSGSGINFIVGMRLSL